MRLLLVILCLFFVSYRVKVSAHYRDDLDDNEFAEFEDFEDEDDETVGSTTKDSASQQTSHSSNAGDQQGPKTQRSSGKDGVEDDDMDEDEEAVVEDDDIEFDEEEFEGFDSDRIGGKVDSKEAPKITITKVPLHLRTNWDSFYLEMLMVAGLVVYFLNFFAGKSRNHKLANAWFTTHRSLLEDNFSLVGDDGKVEADSSTSGSNSGNVGLVKESENIYTLWCSGRTCCEGMLVELKFLKRQDLVAVISQLLRPGGGGSSGADQVLVRVEMNKEDMDSFVLCIAARKTALRLSKDMSDLSLYCPERRPADKFGGPQGMLVLSEMGEVASSLLDSRLLTVLNRYTDMIDYIHFSDQFSGPKQPEDSTPTKLPDTKKVLLFGFNIPLIKSRPVGEVMEQMRPLMQLVFYCMEKVKRFRLSKEAKAKADKNRLRVEEAFLKTTHAARAEAAAARREERKRQEKERILQEEDPEKQRKWEEREARRQMKKRAPKMKQLKVKAL